MKKILFLILILNSFFVFSQELVNKEQVVESTENNIKNKKIWVLAWKLSSRISDNPIKLNYIFDKSFFKVLPYKNIVDILKKLHMENGKVINVSTVAYNNNTGEFFLHTEKGFILPVSITINENTKKISGVFFRPSFKPVKGLNEIVNKFENLPYEKKGILIKKIAPLEEDIYLKNENEIFAIASSFKLYVLANLGIKKTKWDKVIEIKKEDKSLHSGDLYKVINDAPFTVYSLALNMIKNSDNTATDTLIDFIGREKIEKNLSYFYNSRPELNMPFLKTSEMFKIKYSTPLAESYIYSVIKEKRKILEKVDKEPLSIYDIKLDKPYYINSIEWFASLNDMCYLLNYFKKENNSYMNSILSFNPGLDLKTGDFKSFYFKGGSEPGVVSMNYLLETKSGSFYCVSSAINDTKEIINEKEYFSIMQDIINQVAIEVF